MDQRQATTPPALPAQASPSPPPDAMRGNVTTTASPSTAVPHPATPTPSATPAPPTNGAINDRPLNVSDALGYLDEVKNRFHDRPDVYNRFLDIMKDFKSQVLTTPGVIERVSTLFSGHNALISGFNTFLPPGYRIECPNGDNQQITVTTPAGTLTQNAAGILTLEQARVPARTLDPPQTRESDLDMRAVEHESRPSTDISRREPNTTLQLPSKPSTPRSTQSHAPTPQPQQLPPSQPPSQRQTPPVSAQQVVQTHPPPVPPAHPAHITLPSQNPPMGTVVGPGTASSLVLTPSVALNSSATTATAASVLGGMHRVTSNPEPSPQTPTHPPASFHPSLPQGQAQPSSVPLAAPTTLPGPGLQPQPQPEFYHAIQYINRIKTRFADEPETYKQFLEILQTYQKEQRLLHDVYAQVTQLFRNASDLIDEFKMFLPDTSTTAAGTPGVHSTSSFGGPGMGGTGATVGVMGVLGQSGTPGPPSGHPAGTPQGGTTEWTMEVQSVNVKGDKSAGYRRKVAGSDQHREGPPVKKRRRAPDKESRAEKEKDRDRERENMPAVPNPRIASRPKHGNLKPSAPSSPTFAQYGRPPSPANGPHIPAHPSMYSHSSLPPLPPTLHAPLPPPRGSTPPLIPAPPEVFFDRVKRTLDDRDAWEEFLKLLSLFSTDIIEEPTLLHMAAPFLGGQGSELEVQFRDMLGVERERKGGAGEVPRMTGHSHGHVSGLTTTYVSGSKFRYGPSYRRLPDSETMLACSGRDELCRSVLNDDWVSHPTWASEESGFVAHKKNSYEEALHKTEEERHEYHVHLESMAHTISQLEPIAFKLADMAPEERAVFRLGPDLGGRSKSIHQKIIKRVYGRENMQEVLQSLQENPSVAVPVVLDRLKQVDAEWRKNKREWEKVWREVDSRNFYKSLDHQGVGFKANDKKAITGKALLAEIERIKEEQDKKRALEEEAVMEDETSGARERMKRSQVQPRHQLEYDMHDESVLQDAVKLTLSFLERNDQRQSGSTVPQYNTVERRRIEAFLRHYVLHQFGLDGTFDAAFGPPIDQAEWEDLGLYIPDGDEESAEEMEETARKGRKGGGGKRVSGGGAGAGSGGGGGGGAVSAGDLKKKLSKTRRAMERPPAPVGRNKTREAASKANSGSNSSYHRSPTPSSSRPTSPAPVPTSEPVSPVRHVLVARSAGGKEKGKAREAELDDVWLRHVEFDVPGQEGAKSAERGDGAEGHGGQFPPPGDGVQARRSLGSFFCNTTFYTLLRLLQLLYSRLMVCKKLAARLAMDRSPSFLPNPVAHNLGLTDAAGPIAYFADLAGGLDNPSLNPAERFYMHLLDLVEKVFDGELDQTTFEENMRFMFGTRAFVVFTLDKLCAAICKQVQAVVQDFRCHELMSMLEQQRARGTEIDVQDVIRYRRQAEALVGSDENLFRVDWIVDRKCLRIQLLDGDDLSVDPAPALVERKATGGGAEVVNSRMTLRWKHYVQSYVLRYPTEGRRMGVGRKTFLNRTLLDEDADELAGTSWRTDGPGLEVMVGPATCKLYYATGCDEGAWRVREAGTGTRMGENSARRKDHRRRQRRGSGEERDEDRNVGGDEEDKVATSYDRLRERAEARARDRKRWLTQYDRTHF